jgi:plasmid stabilization system protein ParE
VIEYRLVAPPEVDRELEEIHSWYEDQLAGLGDDFVEAVAAAYVRILEGPLKYQVLRSGVRRTLLRRFPYAVYFTLQGTTVTVLTVVHANRNPDTWKSKIKLQPPSE